MINKIYQSGEGFLFKIEMGEDISAASAYSIKVKKPSGTTTSWSPTIGTSTKFYYYSLSTDLDELGVYILQPYLTLGTYTGPCNPVRFEVIPAILY